MSKIPKFEKTTDAIKCHKVLQNLLYFQTAAYLRMVFSHTSFYETCKINSGTLEAPKLRKPRGFPEFFPKSGTNVF